MSNSHLDCGLCSTFKVEILNILYLLICLHLNAQDSFWKLLWIFHFFLLSEIVPCYVWSKWPWILRYSHNPRMYFYWSLLLSDNFFIQHSFLFWHAQYHHQHKLTNVKCPVLNWIPMMQTNITTLYNLFKFLYIWVGSLFHSLFTLKGVQDLYIHAYI